MMNFLKHYSIKIGIALIGIIVVITFFVFYNSLNDYDKSHDTSDVVSEIILPREYATNETILLVVRKMAHLIEYAALGSAVMLLAVWIYDKFGKKYYGSALFYVLLVAVFDEHIQSLSDRTSSTGDILLDFFGSLIGFGIVIIIRLLVKKLKQRKNKGLYDVG